MAPKEDQTAPAVPFADEANPGLDRHSGWLEQQRRDSGGLDDSSPDNPVKDDNPIKITRTRR